MNECNAVSPYSDSSPVTALHFRCMLKMKGPLYVSRTCAETDIHFSFQYVVEGLWELA
jgi:hypothetical protein